MSCSLNLKKADFRLIVSLAALVFIVSACGKSESGAAFTPQFSFEMIDENHVRFTNQTEGDYRILNWDFGNGESESTTSKTEQFEVYYPTTGDYKVTLTVTGPEGESGSVSKTVSISKTDFEVSFSLNIDTNNANNVNLENTSIGNYTSFKWLFRNKVIENETSVVAYFPYAGTYNIELQVVKDGKTFSSVQSVTIAGNDPDYFSKFSLVWADDFDGSSVNTENWTFETGAGGWGNNELENYTNGDNAEVKDGILTITARKVDDYQIAGSYTSSRMITKGKQEFTYGKMEIRAQLPSGKGIWPAIWMLGANIETAGWPACGETDIMEYVGYLPNTVHATVHTPAGYGSNGNGASKTLQTAEEEFHIYGLIWTEKEMIFYTDSPENVTYKYSPANKTADNWPFDNPQFFILNVAVGGNWGGAQGIDNSIFPQSMLVDYVRVYQEP